MFLRNKAAPADPSLVWSPPFPWRLLAPVCFNTVRSAVLRMIRPRGMLGILPLLPRHQAGQGQDVQGLGTETVIERNIERNMKFDMKMMDMNLDDLR